MSFIADLLKQAAATLVGLAITFALILLSACLRTIGYARHRLTAGEISNVAGARLGREKSLSDLGSQLGLLFLRAFCQKTYKDVPTNRTMTKIGEVTRPEEVMTFDQTG